MRHPALLALLLVTAGCASAPALRPPTVLPLRTLRLYETGVGYYERAGTVGTAVVTTLPVPSGHLDDALKSLVVLNGGGSGMVSGLAYSSSVSQGVARARAGLPVDVDHPVTYFDLLKSLKGESISMAAAKDAVVGRLVEVLEETVEVPAPSAISNPKAASEAPRTTSKTVPVLLVLTKEGELIRQPALDLRNVQPLDPAAADRLHRALDSLSPRSPQANRPLSLLGDATGAVSFGYIAETPVWRTTYRLVMTSDGKGSAFQGWALVHNDTDESWTRIGLSLVNGQPDSFIYPLAAPRYQRRTLVHPEEPLSTIPQLQDKTADMLWGDNADTGSGSGEGMGYGGGYGRLSGSHTARAPQVRMGATSVSREDTVPSTLLSVGDLAAVATAPGIENGALFTYTVDKPFSLDAHNSALVPLFQKAVDVEALAWFAEAGASPRNAIRFTNTTGQTLPAGTLAVFASGGFAGESGLDRLKPAEHRFIQFGNELDAELSEKTRHVTEVPKHVTYVEPMFEEHFVRTSRISYELENRTGATRLFYMGLQVQRNATVTGADALDFDESQSRPIVIFRVPAKQKLVRSIEVTEGLSHRTIRSDVGATFVERLLQKTTLPAAELAILRDVLPKAKDVETAEKAKVQADADIAAATADVDRFREHARAVGGDKGGSGAAAAPLVKRLLDAEDRLATAKKHQEERSQDLKARVETLRAALAKLPTPK